MSVPSICIAYPLRGAFDEETIIGAIAGYYDWRRVDERVRFQEEIAPQRGMLLLLMDASHQIVARGSAPSPVVELLQAELPGLHRDIEMRTHAVAGEAFDDSLQLLSMATLSGGLSDVEITYIGVAVAPERLVLSPVRRLAWLTALACLAATVGTLCPLFLSKQVSRQSRRFTTAREIARGNLALEPPPPGGGIGQLAADTCHAPEPEDAADTWIPPYANVPAIGRIGNPAQDESEDKRSTGATGAGYARRTRWCRRRAGFRCGSRNQQPDGLSPST